MKVVYCLSLVVLVTLSAFALGADVPEAADDAAVPRENASAPRNDAWQVIGMGGGGTMQHPLISPHDPELILTACDMTGAYISRDGGDSWRMFNLRTGIECFAFDPNDENVIYAGNDGFFRSRDKGVTWELLIPDVEMNTAEYRRGDHGDHGYESDDPASPAGGGSVKAIAVDPGDSRTIYIAWSGGSRIDGGPYVVVSRDGGDSFEALAPLGEGSSVLAMEIPSEGASPVVFCSNGKRTLVDGEWTKEPYPREMSFTSVAAGRDSGGMVVYGAFGGRFHDSGNRSTVLVSKDLGQSWDDVGDAMEKAFADAESPASFGPVTCCLNNPAVCYASFRGGRMRGPSGLVKTEDYGETWTIIKIEGPRTHADNAAPSWQEVRMSGGGWSLWFDAPRGLAIAPSDPDVCIATDCFRTCRTQDGGKTWETITSKDCGDGQWTTRGLDVTTCYGVHFDPLDEKHIYISYTDMGLFHSIDGGKSWINSIEGIPGNWVNTCYWVECDPDVKDMVWSVWSGSHDIPRPKMWRRRGWTRYGGGVAASTDGGKTWKVTNNGIGQAATTHIIMDGESPAGKRTLYVCAFGKGVYKSVDNGETWTLKNNGITKADPFAWHIERTKNGALYLVVARRSDNGRTFTNDDGGALYVSTDKAESWAEIALPEGVDGPCGLHVDPEDPERMYLAAWGGYSTLEPGPEHGGGIYMTTDGGETWKCVFDADQHVYDVTHDPRTDRLYACGFESRAWYSSDKGETWHPVKGYNFHWGHRVIPDRLDPEKVYITTFGGSVWHGPATGDPDAVEDIVTNIPKKF